MAYTTIDDPEAYFQAKAYTGTGDDAESFTFDGDTDMQPDLTWFKNRGAAAWHNVYDSVRGVNKALATNAANAEESRSDTMDSFDSDGFTLGNDTSQNPDGYNTNADGNTYVAWCWKAGTTSGLSGGGITPSGYSIDTTSKFGIYAYTGSGTAATITHGLGAVPKAMIIKKRNSATTGDWFFHHGSLASGNSLFFNSTNGQDTSDFLGTAPTSTVFTVNSDYANKSSDTYIAYVFAEVKGFSSMGSYVGNGNADGVFVYTGFRPAFVMCKQSSASGQDWFILDNKIGPNPFNPITDRIQASTASAAGNGQAHDLLSNGFKHRVSSVFANGSGSTYMYVAFAETPFVNSNGVPNNAR